MPERDNLAMLVDNLRIGFLAIWAIPAITFLPSVARTTLHRPIGRDKVRCSYWFTSLVMIGFAVLWLFYPHIDMLKEAAENSLRSAMYALGIVAGFYAMQAAWADDD